MRIQQTIRQLKIIFILILIAVFLRKIVIERIFAAPTWQEINTEILDKKNYKSTHIYVYNLTDEEVLYSKNSQEKKAPASLTKLMTALVAMEKIEDYNQPAPIVPEIYQKMIRDNASMAGFFSKEQTNYEDLLYGMLLPSGGECAGSLAYHTGGSTENFVSMMNKKAADLSLINTSFKNPVGLDEEGHYTCAEDMAMIFKEALKYEKFKDILPKASIRSSKTLNHPEGLLMESTLLKELAKYSQNGFTIIGGKSGTTYNAGVCLVSLAVKNDKEIITVVMGHPFEVITDPGDGHIVETIDILENLELD